MGTGVLGKIGRLVQFHVVMGLEEGIEVVIIQLHCMEVINVLVVRKTQKDVLW